MLAAEASSKGAVDGSPPHYSLQYACRTFGKIGIAHQGLQVGLDPGIVLAGVRHLAPRKATL